MILNFQTYKKSWEGKCEGSFGDSNQDTAATRIVMTVLDSTLESSECILFDFGKNMVLLFKRNWIISNPFVQDPSKIKSWEVSVHTNILIFAVICVHLKNKFS